MAMATTKKPAGTTTRKKATKRGPTKAAALKALGLTQEDLDVLKQVAALREEHARASEEGFIGPQTPPEPPKPVQPKPAEDTTPQPEAPTTKTFFARNLRNADASIRLTRQEGKKRRLEFKPRGERGDVQPLQKEDLEDPSLLDNVGLLVEIITAAEAKEIIEKQVVNRQQQVHPAMAMLRNALGEEYVQTEVPVVQDNSYTVAHLEPVGGEAGNLPDQGRGVDWNAIHGGAQPAQAPRRSGTLGGNPHIISDGFARPDDAARADALARKKGLEGPGAAGITQVTVEPVQRT